MGRRNNQPNDGVGGGMDVVGVDAYSSLWVANGATKKIKKREGDGASDFDVFFWMGGHDNQPKSRFNVGL